MTSFKKNLAREILRLRWIAFATDFHTAAVHCAPCGAFLFHRMQFPMKQKATLPWGGFLFISSHSRKQNTISVRMRFCPHLSFCQHIILISSSIFSLSQVPGNVAEKVLVS